MATGGEQRGRTDHAELPAGFIGSLLLTSLGRAMGPYCMFYKHFTVYTSQVLVFCPQKEMLLDYQSAPAALMRNDWEIRGAQGPEGAGALAQAGLQYSCPH